MYRKNNILIPKIDRVLLDLLLLVKCNSTLFETPLVILGQ